MKKKKSEPERVEKNILEENISKIKLKSNFKK